MPLQLPAVQNGCPPRIRNFLSSLGSLKVSSLERTTYACRFIISERSTICIRSVRDSNVVLRHTKHPAFVGGVAQS
ncbi:hypothetical protein KCU61_g379, partial [Aureobasidium melanogenum]